MCGIVYIRRHDGKSAVKSVKKRYQNQKGRGTEGFGYVAIKDNKVVSYERAPTEHEIMQKLDKETAPEILFHHRFPTSGPNVEEMAHPLFVSAEQLEHQYFVAHNGVIHNSRERKIEHEKLGFKYRTELKETLMSVLTKRHYEGSFSKFNDSESLAIDTALALQDGRTILSEGASAVIGFRMDGENILERFFYRNTGNPLYVRTDKIMTTLTSAFVSGGKEVPAGAVMNFDKAFGLIERQPAAFAPFTYRNKRVYGGYADDEYPGMGFVQPFRKELPSGTKSDGTDFTLHFEDEGVRTPSVFEIEASAMTKTEKDSLATMLSQRREDELWEEYKNCSDGLIKLHQIVEQLDKRTEEAGANDGRIKARTKIQLRIDRCVAYQKLIENEFESRDAVIKSLVNLGITE